MAVPTLGGNSLGVVNSIAWTKDGNITPLPFSLKIWARLV